MKLYDPSRHCELIEKSWNPEQIKGTIADIYQRTLQGFDPESFWVSDENEDTELTCNKTVYFGAAGNLYALDKMAQFLGESLPFDKGELIEKIYQRYLSEPDTKEVVPSLFLGESGILLLKYKYTPDESTASRLFAVVEENIKNPTLEALWGAPGTMIAASYMYRWTREEKWAQLYRDNAAFLISTLKEEMEKGELVWTMDMYGKQTKYIGAGHGYFGNIFGMLHGFEMLGENEKQFILENTIKITKELALVEEGLVNWPPVIGQEFDRPALVQWCHGSPGVINALHAFPVNFNEELESLLLGAGELVWQAGPLTKGIALCHGSDGNGYAFLQLYRRTGDFKWLERARAFAGHACTQRNGRFSLFTGESGLALYLISSLNESDSFPFLEEL